MKKRKGLDKCSLRPISLSYFVCCAHLLLCLLRIHRPRTHARVPRRSDNCPFAMLRPFSCVFEQLLDPSAARAYWGLISFGLAFGGARSVVASRQPQLLDSKAPVTAERKGC